jgi:hypothetical protein
MAHVINTTMILIKIISREVREVICRCLKKKALTGVGVGMEILIYSQKHIEINWC